VPAAVVRPLLATARANVAAQRLRTPAEVARAENHRYGVVVIASDVPTATIAVTPIEAWHWEGLAAQGTGTLTFNAPAGRYRVQVSAPNLAPRTQEITVVAGERTRAAVAVQQVAGGAAIAPRRGLPKWAWIAIIGGGAGVAALALGGGGGDGPSTGSIDLQVPIP
jgi:hypothetical protein